MARINVQVDPSDYDHEDLIAVVEIDRAEASVIGIIYEPDLLIECVRVEGCAYCCIDLIEKAEHGELEEDPVACPECSVSVAATQSPLAAKALKHLQRSGSTQEENKSNQYLST